MSDVPTPPRCLLFLPATRPDRYEKALASGADAVCLDLEDAVAFDDKDRARREAVSLLGARRPHPSATIVRVNDPVSPTGRMDIGAICAVRALPDAIMLPKLKSPRNVTEVEAAFEAAGLRVPLVPVIETARGLAEVERIATCSRSLYALMLGGVDLSTEIGSAMGWDELLYARSRVVHAAALGGIGAIDTPMLDVSRPGALEEEARAARRLGFVGKAAIHPRQVPVIQKRFSPTEDEVTAARRIVRAFEAEGGGVFLLDGAMVDRPVVEAARRTLARGGRAEGKNGPSEESHDPRR